MSEGDIEFDGGMVVQMLDELQEQVMQSVRKGITRACLIVHRSSVRNAPISPTNAQYSKAVLKRKKRTKRRMHPGGLCRSIEWELNGNEGAVFIASNSEAAKYAKVIHDMKGVRWKRRGPGTIAKGSLADDKFIERALAQNHRAITNIIEKSVEKGIEDAGTV